jgi:integrase
VTETEGSKNLAEKEATRQETAAGATPKPDQETTRGLIAQYAYWLEKEGHTVPGYLRRIKMLAKLGANLQDPENVKSIIAKQTWNNSTKSLTVYAYDAMTRMLKIQWTRPRYKQQEILPFIPEEAELDQLIAASQSKRMAAFLQTLKETFADPGEAIRLRWIDVNPSNNTITINQPVKGHNARQLQVSTRLIAMLMALPKTSERIFPMNYESVHSNYSQFRKRVAYKLKNPRLQKISFNTFRHWGATMTYHYTRKILLVQKLLGHKRIESTMKYTRLVHFKDDEFDVETATTVEEAKELLKIGFDYITDRNGISLFRRPKRFGPAMGVPEDP